MAVFRKIAMCGIIHPRLFTRTFVMSVVDRNHQQFHDKTAVVTGSTDGIGFATARRLAQDGAFVVISSRKQQNVDRALAKLHQEGLKNVSGLVCDAGSKKDRAVLIEHTLARRPGIDFLVSNVATYFPSPLLETSEKDWDAVLDLNLKSHVYLTQEALPYIKSQKKGSIVYISSMVAYLSIGHAAPYSASKTALLQVMKLAATQLGPLNIRVNCVAPGVIETEMSRAALEDEKLRSEIEQWPALKRAGQPDEIAGVVAFLCSDDASYITGETIVAAGGIHCRI